MVVLPRGFPPGDRLQHHRAHGDVDRRHHRDREQDGSRDIPLRAPHFAGDVADLVVAPEAVHGDHRGGPERRPEPRLEALRRGEGGKARTVEQPGRDHPAGGGEHERQHRLREALHGLDVPVEEEEHQHAHPGGGEVVGKAGQVREVEAQVVGEAHRPAGERERRHQQDVEQEQEGHHPAETEGAKRLAEVEVRPSAAGERRPELCIDEPVGQREQRAEEPGPDDVRPAHRRHHQRDRQEGADPDHPDDVRRGGPGEAHPPLHRFARSGPFHPE